VRASRAKRRPDVRPSLPRRAQCAARAQPARGRGSARRPPVHRVRAKVATLHLMRCREKSNERTTSSTTSAELPLAWKHGKAQARSRIVELSSPRRYNALAKLRRATTKAPVSAANRRAPHVGDSFSVRYTAPVHGAPLTPVRASFEGELSLRLTYRSIPRLALPCSDAPHGLRGPKARTRRWQSGGAPRVHR
jgi:hypothetical protein